MKTALFAAALAVISTCAYANNCAPQEGVKGRLSEKYKEAPRIEAYNNVGILELWVSETIGTWTVTVTTPDRTTCVLAAGQGFYQHPEQPQGEEM